RLYMRWRMDTDVTMLVSVPLHPRCPPAIVDPPEQGPGMAAIFGPLPIPLKPILANVIEHHARDVQLALHLSARRERQLAVGELSDKVQIVGVVVHPGLPPLSQGWIKGGDT